MIGKLNQSTRIRMKTFSHLSRQKRVPTEYELLTSRLLYYVGKGFEVKTPIAAWYDEHQLASPLKCSDWDVFKEPHELTYTKYVNQQREREIFVDALLRGMEETRYDSRLNDAWLVKLASTLSVLRFPYHGLQMATAYIGSMAPSGRITVALAFQAANELRKVQILSRRLGLIQKYNHELGLHGREAWETTPSWQPLRKAIENLLTTYDWAEALVVLNLCLKPTLDNLFLERFGDFAKGEGDPKLEDLFRSLYEDSKWQMLWTNEFFKMVTSDSPENENLVREWISKWNPLCGEIRAAAEQSLFSDIPVKRAMIGGGSSV